jgi:hypothetical protein
MSTVGYSVTLTQGTQIAVVAPNTIFNIDTPTNNSNSSGIVLIGQNYQNYGQFIANNFVRLLENQASIMPPNTPLEGQLWWDKTNKTLNTFNGTKFKSLACSITSSTAPVNLNIGDQWWDTVNKELNVYNGIVPSTGEVQWVTIGPVGANFVANNALTSNTAVYSNNSGSLGGILASKYLNTEVGGTVLGPLSAQTGLTVNSLTINGNSSNMTINSTANVIMSSNTTTLSLNGTTDVVTITQKVLDTTSPATAIATKGYVDTTVANLSTNDISIKANLSSLNANVTSIWTAINNDPQFNTHLITAINSRASLVNPVLNGLTVNNLVITKSNLIDVNIANSTGNIILSAGSAVIALNAHDNNITINQTPVLPNAIATKGYVDTTINTHVSSALSSYMDANISAIKSSITTISSAINNDPNFYTNLTAELSVYAVSNNTILTGNPTAPKPIITDNSNRIATTSFVQDIATDPVITSLTPMFNGNINIGSTAFRFDTLYARTTNLTNADLAEKYVADAEYEPGTVLDFGGYFEVTLAKDIPFKVAGVVSTSPAQLLNSECSGEFTAILALTGRCPVKVLGPVRKGDILVSAGEGYAKASMKPAAGTIIGKALESFYAGTGVIEVSIIRG